LPARFHGDLSQRADDGTQVAAHRSHRRAPACEATTIVIAPAIANAVFAATGPRPREVPFTGRKP
jgi:CO/xanthine dehydrogenase Mo-binding subunit